MFITHLTRGSQSRESQMFVGNTFVSILMYVRWVWIKGIITGVRNGLENLEISIKTKKTHTLQTKNLLPGNLSYQNKSNNIKITCNQRQCKIVSWGKTEEKKTTTTTTKLKQSRKTVDRSHYRILHTFKRMCQSQIS